MILLVILIIFNRSIIFVLCILLLSEDKVLKMAEEVNQNQNSLLEGTEKLPEAVNIIRILKARAKEILALQSSIAQQTGTKLIFQRLPKHMRRRTMSHNVKRLPRRVREAHLSQMKKSGLPPKQKRPSRKFRRRPKNLMQNYTRRQRTHAWLETHIWHAKRFHMINRWGYRLPDRPCDKAFRACYRASAKHCLLQDISYIGCVELSGNEDLLTSHLKLVTNSSTGLTIAANAFKNGAREGNTIFYHINSYPFKAIGEVKFLWKPVDNENSIRTLWIWVHTAYYQDVIECLIELFNLNKIKSETSNDVQYKSENGIKMVELKHSLNRFRLTGPLAHSIIMKSLRPAPTENESPWLREYLESAHNSNSFNEQTQFWNTLRNINSSSELSPHIVFNLIVTDPRYSFPSKRTKAITDNSESADIVDIPSNIKFGALWHEKTRNTVSQNKFSTSEINNQRKNILVPDDSAPLHASAVPILLIQQSGNRDSSNHLGYCSGWDIILPANWGRPFWLSYILWGARAGGIRESQLLRFEQGLCPLLQPDTKSGQTEESRISELYKEKFFNLPPNKRVNYVKFGITNPFSHPWNTIIAEWNLQQKTAKEFYVLRDKNKLQLLQSLLTKKNVQNIDFNFNDNCLIPIRLNLVKRGRAKKFSIICLPKEQDYKNKSDPIEPMHKDENQITRKSIRDAHQKLLKTLRRRRVRAKSNGKEIPTNNEIIEEHAEKMRALWLPQSDVVRKSCSREVMGFVTNGDFSYATGNARCVGFVASGALEQLINKSQKDLVLVRNTTTKQYRFAKIEVICTI